MDGQSTYRANAHHRVATGSSLLPLSGYNSAFPPEGLDGTANKPRTDSFRFSSNLQDFNDTRYNTIPRDLQLANLSTDTSALYELNTSAEEFEAMVGDLRRSFIGWLKKTDTNLKLGIEKVERERKENMEIRDKIYKQFYAEKQLELDKLKEERRKFDADLALQMKQMQVERDDIFRKLEEKKVKQEAEIESIKRVLSLEKQRLNQQLEDFEMEKHQILDANIATETMIELNVGGVIFETSRQTLAQQQGSFLEGIFSGRYAVNRDKQGYIFLDKDADIFRTILNFLRDPTMMPLPRDLNESEAIVKDANYYGIKFFPFPLAFIIGGHSGVEHLNSVEVLDVAQQLWRPCKPMQTERSYFGCAASKGFIYAFGGHNLDYKALCDMEVYDALRDIWFAGPNLNIPRRNTSAAFSAGRLYAVGGFDGMNILSSVETHDRRMRQWMELAPMLTPRSSATCCVLDEKLYVIGGTRGDRLKTVECFDPRMNKWEACADLLEVRSAASSVQYLDSMFVLGGTDNSQTILDSVELQIKQENKWSFVRSMPEPRMDFSAALISDSILVAGGQNISVLGTTDFYRINSNEWQPGPTLLIPRYGHSVQVLNL